MGETLSKTFLYLGTSVSLSVKREDKNNTNTHLWVSARALDRLDGRTP